MEIPEKIFEALAKKMEGNIRSNLRENPDYYWYWEFYTELPELNEWGETNDDDEAEERMEAFERELIRRIRRK